ncbi:MAG: hypothetical protein JWR77_2311 [Rhizorhabdus sp.]|nr:hypothetical protein [Rhizorhabdus sp.]
MMVTALTAQPAECLHLPEDPAARAKVEIGRAAFRTPLLLGGQAARLGLSCESCHTNGRSNPAFRFPGLSDAPGTADVTASLMSTHRDNGIFDPRPIPDLAMPGKVSRAMDRADLRNFIEGLIVGEFDGHAPPPAVLEGLTFYVRSIDMVHCPERAPQATLAAAWSDAATRAVAAAGERWQANDAPSTILMLDSARSFLGRLDERYARIASDHDMLVKADAELRAIQKHIEAGLTGADQRMSAWLLRAPAWKIRLLSDEQRSLFNPDQLAAAAQS